MADLYTIASSNSPSGSEAIGNSLDDYLRSSFAILRSTNALSSFTLASASTVDLGTADAEHVQITGTATIASFGTSVPGLTRECRFTSALTITASTNIITPGGADIAVAAGDILVFRSMGSGVWRAVSSCGAALVRDGALSIAKTNGLQAALDAKAATSSLGSAAFASTSAFATAAQGATADAALPRSGGTISSGTLTINQPGSSGTGLTVTGTTLAGAGILLQGNGTTTPSKLIAVRSGTLYVKADDGSTTLASMNDNGDLAVAGGLTPGGGKKLSKITLSSSAPGTLADGELYLRF
jgi:hypothetical protein